LDYSAALVYYTDRISTFRDNASPSGMFRQIDSDALLSLIFGKRLLVSAVGIRILLSFTQRPVVEVSLHREMSLVTETFQRKLWKDAVDAKIRT
jgi:hypothetical protein